MSLLSFIGFAIAICFFTLLGSFFAFLITKKTGIIDVFWGLGITISSVSIIRLAGETNGLTQMVSIMILIWGARLSGLFILRVLSQSNDRRYEKMIKTSSTVSMLKNCFIQGPLQVLIVMTVFPLTHPIYFQFSWPLFLGFTLYCLGLIGETVADFQLSRHKKISKHICMTGLWKFSRHPNYFFECMIWFGISILFVNSPYFVFSLIGPISNFIIIFFITGPYSERCSLERHGDVYLNYQNKTSYFFPWKHKN